MLAGQRLNEATLRRAGDAAFEGARAPSLNGFKVELGIRTISEAVKIAARR